MAAMYDEQSLKLNYRRRNLLFLFWFVAFCQYVIDIMMILLHNNICMKKWLELVHLRTVIYILGKRGMIQWEAPPYTHECNIFAPLIWNEVKRIHQAIYHIQLLAMNIPSIRMRLGYSKKFIGKLRQTLSKYDTVTLLKCEEVLCSSSLHRDCSYVRLCCIISCKRKARSSRAFICSSM